MELSSLFKDVASIIAEKCINPKTQRPYTITMIERALRDCHFSVDPKRSAKQQALQAGSEASSLSLGLLRHPKVTIERPAGSRFLIGAECILQKGRASVWLYEGCSVAHQALVSKEVSCRQCMPHRRYMAVVCRLYSR